jgi:hypothetical protein
VVMVKTFSEHVPALWDLLRKVFGIRALSFVIVYFLVIGYCLLVWLLDVKSRWDDVPLRGDYL